MSKPHFIAAVYKTQKTIDTKHPMEIKVVPEGWAVTITAQPSETTLMEIIIHGVSISKEYYGANLHLFFS